MKIIPADTFERAALALAIFAFVVAVAVTIINSRRRSRTNWKVIGTDNFNRDNHSDYLAEDFLTEHKAALLADELNGRQGDYAETYYKAVPRDYKLYKWEP